MVSLKELASLEVFNLVENVSEDLLMIIKSFVHLHYIASELNVNAVEVARVFARYAYRGDTIYRVPTIGFSQARWYFHFCCSYLVFKIRYAGMALKALFSRLVFRVRHFEIL